MMNAVLKIVFFVNQLQFVLLVLVPSNLLIINAIIVILIKIVRVVILIFNVQNVLKDII